MTVRIRRLVVAATLCLLLCSCGGDEGFRKETFPVSGEVHVDGQPAAQLAVVCHDVKGLDAEHPTGSSGLTDDNGKFEIGTYEGGDGVPEGEYVLTFTWKKRDILQGNPDKLKDRYSDPTKSEQRFTVEAGKPTELGRIELTTE